MTNYVNEDEIIEEIINSFETFALGDIEHNVKEKPIAAFILCSCLIDQLATFVYNPPVHPNSRNKFYYEKFIDEYLNSYVPLKLYVNLRCNLVHNYTIGEFLSITSDTVVRGDDTTVIHAYKIFRDLKDAFEKIKLQLRDRHTNSPVRKNAIARYAVSKIISGKTQEIIVYSQEVCRKLMEYYGTALLPFIKKMSIIKKVEIEQWTSEMEGNFFIIVKLITDKGESTFLLEDMIKMANLDAPSIVLQHLNETQGNAPSEGISLNPGL